VTNGREFKLYQTSRLESPILAWNFQDTDDNFLRFFNILSPAAVRARARANLVDPGMPLGRGLGSRLRVAGGEILYEEIVGDDPFLKTSSIGGLRLPIVGGSVHRTEDKRILGRIEISKPAPLITVGDRDLSDAYGFLSASEFLSDDPERPTIFQNRMSKVSPAGTLVNIPGLGTYPTQFGFSFSAFTEAVGYIAGGKFVGTICLACDFDYSKMESSIRRVLAIRLGFIPDHSQVTGSGRFEVSLISDF
jgi:hypothetical protein